VGIEGTQAYYDEVKFEIEVRRFIESDDVKDKVKDDPYNIIVYSKDKKEIN
jgi:hypothetical protein